MWWEMGDEFLGVLITHLTEAMAAHPVILQEEELCLYSFDKNLRGSFTVISS